MPAAPSNTVLPTISCSEFSCTFDQLGKGEDYAECKPTIHIGFLDFTPFPEYPEFYATYMMSNIKNHNLYSDKFVLRVVDLTHIELATDKDRCYGIDRWAKLFKASTWEELKMIANDNQVLTEASKSLYQLSADEIMQQRCRARQDAILYENAMKRQNQALADKVDMLTAEKKAWDAEREQLLAKLAEYEGKSNRG